MKREIKFRAWDGQQMHYLSEGKYITIWDDLHRVKFGMYRIDDDTLITKEDRGMELMQFTGLEDKNGKRIYEGDIICFPKYEGTQYQLRAVIEWEPEQLRFTDFSPKNEVEVIGNIFENPEILKP